MHVQATKNTGNGRDVFDPQQWLSEDHTTVTINKAPGNTVFSSGPRGCPGQDLTITEVLVAVIVFAREVQSIKITEEEMKVPLNTALTWTSDVCMQMVPRGGCKSHDASDRTTRSLKEG